MEDLAGANRARSAAGRRHEIALGAVHNLRDLGGHPTVDRARRTRWRVLFRGAGLHRLAGEDARVVAGLGLRTIIDLRTEGEVTAVGSYPVARLPAEVHHLPMIQRMWDHSRVDPEMPAARYLLERYEEMLVEGREAIARAVSVLAQPRALPAAFFCAAGKDRTGVLAAIVLDALGVQEACIVADYHVSEAHLGRIARGLRGASERSVYSAMILQPATVMAAPSEAMRLLLRSIRARHGSARGYLLEIGVQESALDALAGAFLERGQD